MTHNQEVHKLYILPDSFYSPCDPSWPVLRWTAYL